MRNIAVKPTLVIIAAMCALALPAAAGAVAVLVQNTRMHIDCVGEGAPAVVLDAGLGGSSLEWTYVRDRLAPITRVCVFDRAGYGASDMGPLPRTSSVIANELYLLLDAAGVDGPYIMVGHSFGGYNAQLFARRYPYLTAGLVLIDASHPEQVDRFLAPPLRMITAPSSRYGIVRYRDPPPPHAALPAAVRRQILARAGTRRTRRTLGAELLSFRDSARQVLDAPPLGDLPLLVISRGKLDGEVTERRVLMEKLWLEMQSELAASSRSSAHLLARAAGHHVHIEQPELTAFGIALLLDRARDAPLDLSSFQVRDVAWLNDALNLDQRASAGSDAAIAWCDAGNPRVVCADGAP